MNAIATKPIIQAPPLEPERKPRNYRWLLLLLFIAISAILYLAKEPTETQHWETVDFIEKGADGEPQVPQKDLEKLKRDLDKMNNGVLYSLRAGKAGYYACYNCGDQDSIYLQVGEIWKYGVTYQGEKGRYPLGFEDERLVFYTEFRGNYGICLQLEKEKIIYYRILPENLRRTPPIIRPPGNKITR